MGGILRSARIRRPAAAPWIGPRARSAMSGCAPRYLRNGTRRSIAPPATSSRAT